MNECSNRLFHSRRYEAAPTSALSPSLAKTSPLHSCALNESCLALVNGTKLNDRIEGFPQQFSSFYNVS